MLTVGLILGIGNAWWLASVLPSGNAAAETLRHTYARATGVQFDYEIQQASTPWPAKSGNSSFHGTTLLAGRYVQCLTSSEFTASTPSPLQGFTISSGETQTIERFRNQRQSYPTPGRDQDWPFKLVSAGAPAEWRSALGCLFYPVLVNWAGEGDTFPVTQILPTLRQSVPIGLCDLDGNACYVYANSTPASFGSVLTVFWLRCEDFTLSKRVIV